MNREKGGGSEGGERGGVKEERGGSEGGERGSEGGEREE